MDGLDSNKIMKYDPGINVIMCTTLGQRKLLWKPQELVQRLCYKTL